MAAKKPSAKKMKTLPQKLSAKEASSVKGGAVVAKGSTRMDESPKETVTFEYGGLQTRYSKQ